MRLGKFFAKDSFIKKKNNNNCTPTNSNGNLKRKKKRLNHISYFKRIFNCFLIKFLENF